MNGIKIFYRDNTCGYIDFTVGSDTENFYRWERATGKMRKLFGIGRSNYGKAIRGNERKKIEQYAAMAYHNNLPFVIFG